MPTFDDDAAGPREVRDVEKLFQTRFHTIFALDEPPILVPTLAQWVPSLAAHDDNHLAQMERALERAP